MATYQTPQGERRIIIRQITLGGDYRAKVEGYIALPGGPSVDFNTYHSFRPAAGSDDVIYLAAMRLETLLSEAIALKVGILPTSDDTAVEPGGRL